MRIWFPCQDELRCLHLLIYDKPSFTVRRRWTFVAAENMAAVARERSPGQLWEAEWLNPDLVVADPIPNRIGVILGCPSHVILTINEEVELSHNGSCDATVAE